MGAGGLEGGLGSGTARLGSIAARGTGTGRPATPLLAPRKSMTSASRAGGTAGFRSRTGAGVPTEREVSTAMTVVPGNGNSPVQSWYNTHPRLKRSPAAVTSELLACSGAMYAGVPTVVPGLVICTPL